MRKLLLAAVLFLVPSILQAHKFEPINTEYAPPVEVFTLDLTPQVFRRPNGANFFLLPEVGLEMPLTTWSQMELSVPYLLFDPKNADSSNGFGDLQLGFRAALPAPKGGPKLATNFEVVAPTGDSRQGLAKEATEIAAGFFASQETNRGIFFGNFSYAAEYPKDEEGHENLLEYATAAVFNINRVLHPTLELFGESNLTSNETELYSTPEMIVGLSDRSELKLAVPIGMTESSDDWGVQFQLTLFLGEHPEPGTRPVHSPVADGLLRHRVPHPHNVPMAAFGR